MTRFVIGGVDFEGFVHNGGPCAVEEIEFTGSGEKDGKTVSKVGNNSVLGKLAPGETQEFDAFLPDLYGFPVGRSLDEKFGPVDGRGPVANFSNFKLEISGIKLTDPTCSY